VSTVPDATAVVVRTTSDADTNVSPAGAGGRVNSNSDHRMDDVWIWFVNAGTVFGVDELT
jgi:hypothetical protein